MARTVPAGENRGPRNILVAIYLSEEELRQVDGVISVLEARSRSEAIIKLMLPSLKLVVRLARIGNS